MGRYRLLTRLGEGGMGVVWAAWDPELDRRVGIKLISKTGSVSSDMLRRRLRREAQAMARLHHANVVAVHDVGESNGQLFVAMEYVDGVNLRTWLATPRSGPEILAVFRSAGEGLAAAHAEGVIHRDFKPDNVIVGRDGHVRVLDFGLAGWAGGSRHTSESPCPDEDVGDDASSEPVSTEDTDAPADDIALTRPGVVLGTLRYMAPEQRLGHSTDARSDQYAFCVALWQALNGELPFGRGSRSRARARLGRTAAFRRKDVPRSVEHTLRRGLAWRAEDRWPDMHALLDHLQPRRRARWWPAAAALAAALTAGLVSLAAVEEPAGPSCELRSTHVAEIWNASAADRLADVFARHGELGGQIEPYLRAEIERWVERWTEVDGALCKRYAAEAPHVHERQLVCLDGLLDRLALSLDQLASLERDELGHGIELLADLPTPSSCRNPSAGSHAANDDDPRRVALAQRLAQIRNDELVGRVARAEADSAKLLDETAAAGLDDLQLDIAELRAPVLVSLARHDEAIEMALVGLRAAERGGAAQLRVRGFALVANMYAYSQDVRSAKSWLANAEALAEAVELERAVHIELLETHARIIALDGRIDEAIEAHDRLLAMLDPESERLRVAQSTLQRAELLRWKGKSQLAVEQLELGGAMLTELVGPAHPMMLDLRLQKAMALISLDHDEQARAELLAVADAKERLNGGPSSESVAARGRAAWLLDRVGSCEAARAEFDAMMAAARVHMPNPSPDLGELLSNRAQICDHGSPEAVAYAREALELYRRAVGDEHVMIAEGHRMIARTLYAAGQLDEAAIEVERSLAMFATVAPIGAEFVPEVQALAMLIAHGRGQPDALVGREQLLELLPSSHVLGRRLAVLP